ncbi:MAG: tetratricopeptide repeat protein [Magnetococcus sp. YQC-3]
MISKQMIRRRTAVRRSPVYNRAFALYVEGKIPEALAVANDIVHGYKPNAVILDLAAICHGRLGNPGQAIACWRQAIQLEPDCADLYANMGAFLREQNRLSEAEEACRQAVRIQPDHSEAWRDLGEILKELGQLVEAEECLHQAMAMQPEAEQTAITAEEQLPDKEVEQAAVSGREALQAGIALHKAGQLDAAIHCYRQAIRINSENVVALSNMGVALQSKGRLGEAMACHKKAIAIRHDFATAHYNLGNVLKEMGALDPAVVSYQKAIAIKPDFADAHNNLGNTLKDLGALELAAASLQRAIAIQPDYAEAHNNLGVALYNMGKLELAVASYQKAIAIQADYAEAHSNLSAVLHDLDKTELAVASFRQAIAIQPGYADALFNFHAILCDTSPESAIESLARAAQCAPQEGKIQFFLAMLNDYVTDAGLPEEDALCRDSVPWLVESWQYIKSRGKPYPLLFGTTKRGLRLGIEHAHLEGLVLEFGVRHGSTIRQIASLVRQEVHGFDSFQGLPESWHGKHTGIYSTHGELPNVPENVTLHVGLFARSLPAFLERYPGPVRFVNVDCDLYSSTKTVLTLLAGRVVPGTVIVFDEYIANRAWQEDEYRAFQEAARKFAWRYDYIGFSLFSKQVVIRITGCGTHG